MSELEYDIILQAINQICETHKEGTKAILLKQEADAVVFGKDLHDIKEHLASQNSSIAKLQERSNKGEKIVEEFRRHQKFGQWVHKNWYVVLGLFVASVLLVMGLYELIGLRGLIEMMK